MFAPVPLADFARKYALARGLAASSFGTLKAIVASFGTHLGRTATVADLERQTVNTWLLGMLEAGRSRETVATYRRGILTLWRAFAEESGVDPPKGIMSIAANRRPPRAWTAEQLVKLLAVATSQVGRFHGKQVARADFWRAFILVGYETGLRLGDLLDLRTDQVKPDGTLVVVQSKTGEVAACQLSEQAMEALGALASIERRSLFGDLLSRRSIQETFALLLEQAGLDGSTKWLRRTGATQCEIAAPGSAMAFLGHKTPGLAYKNYVDPTQVAQNKPRPPRLTV